MSRPTLARRTDVQDATLGWPPTIPSVARSVLDARFDIRTTPRPRGHSSSPIEARTSGATRTPRGSGITRSRTVASPGRPALDDPRSSRPFKKIAHREKIPFTARHEYGTLTTASTNSMTGSRAPPSVAGCTRRPRPGNAAVPGKVALALHSDRVRLQFSTSPLRSVSPHTEGYEAQNGPAHASLRSSRGGGRWPARTS